MWDIIKIAISTISFFDHLHKPDRNPVSWVWTPPNEQEEESKYYLQTLCCIMSSNIFSLAKYHQTLKHLQGDTDRVTASRCTILHSLHGSPGATILIHINFLLHIYTGCNTILVFCIFVWVILNFTISNLVEVMSWASHVTLSPLAAFLCHDPGAICGVWELCGGTFFFPELFLVFWSLSSSCDWVLALDFSLFPRCFQPSCVNSTTDT